MGEINPKFVRLDVQKNAGEAIPCYFIDWGVVNKNRCQVGWYDLVIVFWWLTNYTGLKIKVNTSILESKLINEYLLQKQISK